MSGTVLSKVSHFQVLTMKLRKPPTTASIWSSGKITCTGTATGFSICFSLQSSLPYFAFAFPHDVLVSFLSSFLCVLLPL